MLDKHVKFHPFKEDSTGWLYKETEKRLWDEVVIEFWYILVPSCQRHFTLTSFQQPAAHISSKLHKLEL